MAIKWDWAGPNRRLKMITKVSSKGMIGRMFLLAFIVALAVMEFDDVLRAQEAVQDLPKAGVQLAPLAGVVTSTQNAQQIAILHWYPANQTAAFTVGATPEGVAFDGANMWVANFGSSTVTKIRASDGFIVGTFSVGSPTGVAFDGANIWVSDFSSGTITKLLASDGSTLGSFAVGTNPWDVAFDGTNIWVANFGSNNVTKLKTTGTTTGTFAVGNGPRLLAYDGANIWVANDSSNSVTELKASTGAKLGTFAVGGNPDGGVAFDGANVWVTNSSSGTVSKL